MIYYHEQRVMYIEWNARVNIKLYEFKFVEYICYDNLHITYIIYCVELVEKCK